MQQLLNEILDEVRPLIGRGKVADYIPALAGVEPNQLGIAVYSRDGELFHAGDALRPFSIQSISKVFSLVQAIQHSGEDIWQRLGHEPSGQPFNSLVQLEFERGKPRNPFINAGALVICDINQSRFAAPAQSMRDFVRRLCGNPEVVSDSVVARSEYQHRSRNAAAAYLMKSFGNFHNDVEAVLLSFAYRVGLPGKSGVGGGIIAVVPGRFTVCVWSPELNAAGNSLAGIAALEKLSERIGWSIF